MIVSDVRTKNGFNFSVQILNTEGGFLKVVSSAVTGAWFRAKIRRISPVKREAEVTFIDYGNQDTIGFADIRPLDRKFQTLPGQAHDARLRCATCHGIQTHLSLTNIDRAATYLRNSSVNTGREVIIPCKCGEVVE